MVKRGETLTPTLFSDLFRSELEEIVAKAVRAVKLVFPGAKVVDRIAVCVTASKWRKVKGKMGADDIEDLNYLHADEQTLMDWSTNNSVYPARVSVLFRNQKEKLNRTRACQIPTLRSNIEKLKRMLDDAIKHRAHNVKVKVSGGGGSEEMMEKIEIIR